MSKEPMTKEECEAAGLVWMEIPNDGPSEEEIQHAVERFERQHLEDRNFSRLILEAETRFYGDYRLERKIEFHDERFGRLWQCVGLQSLGFLLIGFGSLIGGCIDSAKERAQNERLEKIEAKLNPTEIVEGGQE